MRRKRTDSNHDSVDWLVSELNGQFELGAIGEVRKLTRAILHHPGLRAIELWEAVRAIGTMDFPRKWRRDVERTYARLARKEQRRARSTMMSYYCTIWEPDLALSFCSLRNLRHPGGLMFAMDIYLHFGNLVEAKAVARKCERALAQPQSPFDAGYLIEALASYHARRRDWARALEVWSIAPRDQPLARNAAVGIAEVFIAGALDTIGGELTTVKWLSQQAASELALSMPGIEEKLLKDTEKDLLRLKRGLERLLPEKRRRALGLI